MNTRWMIRSAPLIAGALFLQLPRAASACAVCYGAADSPMTKGMNAGIFALLGVTAIVLGGLAAFMVYLAVKAKRSAADGAGLELAPGRERSL